MLPSSHVWSGEHGPAVPATDALAAPGNSLVQVRLGLASSLFVALRAKHARTADHCLRVAFGCSSWCKHTELSETQRDEVEVASLLHDIGKIGVPDQVLLKPSELTKDEAATVQQHRFIGVQILLSCCASQEILNIVNYASGWYDGSRQGFDRSGRDLPIGARMVSILDAYDAMTTDHVYRRAMSRERAIAELFEFAGSQFDPELVYEFCDLLTSGKIQFSSEVARPWLSDLTPSDMESKWSLGRGPRESQTVTLGDLFHERLLNSLTDAVVYVDLNQQILLWNRAAERLTGLSAKSLNQKTWCPSIVQMISENKLPLEEEDCPIRHALQYGTQIVRRLQIQGRSHRRIAVDTMAVPVVGRDGVLHGATLIMHDASSQVTLEETVQALHEKATKDPLTQVANRAEFDRVHEQFVRTHLEQNLPCSLIICDLDHFKRVNDTFGHQAGDASLVSFASLLQRSCRTGDLVARYGGEEFVMLCADCDNATATARAEELRAAIADIPQPVLQGKRLTASFGVTQIQAGDQPETMLRRADRALFQAKEAGRNRVVQLGSGLAHSEGQDEFKQWFHATSQGARQLLCRRILTPVPIGLASEKLKGFIADHHAEVASWERDEVTVEFDLTDPQHARRRSDRKPAMILDVAFSEVFEAGATCAKTVLEVSIRPKRNRERRREEMLTLANSLMSSLKSYLMASDYQGPQVEPTGSGPTRAEE